MNTLAATTPDEDIPRARVALLLKHFSVIKDDREPWRVVYPLREVLLLVVCGTIADCDDFDDIVAWGEDHIDFLRRFCEFHHGIPCERWVRTLFNRVDPVLFSRCFKSWVAALWPDRHEFIAIDGKTSRRTHDERKGLKALHTLSAYATNARLTLAQLGVPEKTNEITAIPEILDELAEHKQLKGAMVTIDAMGCQVAIADKTRPDRDPRLYSIQQCRLDFIREELPWPTALQQHQDDSQGLLARRVSRSLQLRNALLYLVGQTRHRTPRQSRTRPLGGREHALAP